ncbi:MAG: glycine/betaine/sarcosine/D-proline family reductase selenoprotein B [Acidimicrobiia bacterium]|nr:glycine/betaine/sarcosine/D-proline family reductase selenoprotein B [Acidimicrobiia bacterium]
MADAPETFEEFRKSFSYGERSDLDFKFMKSLSDDEAAQFLAGLLAHVGDAYDHARLTDIIDYVIDWQARAYAPAPDAKRTWVYEEGPFATPAKPLADSRVALLTSSGHFVHDDDPEPFGVVGMTQQEAEERISEFLKVPPELSRVPVSFAPGELRVRHGGYDVTSAALDHNVAFPLDHLHDLQADGVIGELHDEAFSFMGAAAQMRLQKETAPEWAKMLRDAEVDVVLLVPV